MTITMAGKGFNYTMFQTHLSKQTLDHLSPLMGLKKSDRMKDGDTPSPFEVFHIQIFSALLFIQELFLKRKGLWKRQKECCNLPA